MQLRDYQHEAKRAVYESMRSNRSVLLVLPTGGGKTVLFADIVRDAAKHGRRAIVAVHRRELIEQAARKLSDVGIVAEIVQGARKYSRTAQCYVASVQTIARRDDFPLCDLVIVDEAHHSIAPTYRALLDHQHTARVLGVTATPIRTNGAGLSDVFSDMIVGADIGTLIERGYLVGTRVYAAPLRESLALLPTTGGDYNGAALGRFMERSVLKGDIVEAYERHASGRKVVLFASNVELSIRYAAEYNARGIRAAHVDGETPEQERAEIFAAFARGDIRVLCNVGIATEGVDIPDCDCVQLLRPTKSLALYLQMIGRGLRAANGKTDCIVLDHADCTLTHGFAEDAREWSLRGKRAKRKDKDAPKITTVPLDGLSGGRNGLEHVRTVELRPMTAEEIAQREYPEVSPELLHLVQRVKRAGTVNKRGRVDAMQALRMYERGGGVPTQKDLEFVARVAGYNWRWARHYMEAQQQRAEAQHFNTV